jgi:VanZ family protein
MPPGDRKVNARRESRQDRVMLRRYGPFLITVMISLYALFSPASGIPFLPPGADKVGHFALFTTLALTGRMARLAEVPLAIGLVVYAVGSEPLQGALPINREASVWDALTDLCGTAIGLWLARRARR